MNELPLTSLDIGHFRRLRSLKLDSLSRINLIVGENNAGKTSVLDALALFCRPLDIANWRETARGREVKSARTPETEPFRWLFPQFIESLLPDPHAISIHGKGEFAGRRLVAHYEEFQEFGDSDAEQESVLVHESGQEPEIGMNIRVLAHYALSIAGQLDNTRENQNQLDFKVVDNRRNVYPTAVNDPSIDLAFISPHTHRTSQDTSWYLSRAIQREKLEENFREAVLEILRRIDPEVMDLSIVETGKTTTSIFIKHRQTGQTPIHAFGDGFRRALLIAATIPSVRNGVLLIDEIEAALHVSVLDSVMETLRWAADLYNVQIFATTHSLDAVDAVIRSFNQDLAQLVGYHLPDRGSEAGTKRMDGEFLKRVRLQRGLEIR